MVDIFSKETRSKIMSSIRGKNTLIEDMVAKELYNNQIRFSKNVKSLLGTPDIAIKKYKIVIFLDSCFWHCCPEHFKMPKTNKEYWQNKIAKNIQRDAKIMQYYKDNNWNILRVWEHEIMQNFKETINKIITFIQISKALK